MTEEIQKEQFSYAYVRAIAAVAGIKVDKPEVDDDSVDLRFSVKSVAGATVPPLIETQVKATADSIKHDGLHYELKLKNYNDLRGERIVPRYLIVLLVPPIPAEWLNQTTEQLVLKKCAYWLSLKDLPVTKNATSVTVTIPSAQVFSVEVLTRMMLGESL